eukprot:SAG31_NODE_257_length_18942_cov_6.099135_6_plen_78_part_00
MGYAYGSAPTKFSKQLTCSALRWRARGGAGRAGAASGTHRRQPLSPRPEADALGRVAAGGRPPPDATGAHAHCPTAD